MLLLLNKVASRQAFYFMYAIQYNIQKVLFKPCIVTDSQWMKIEQMNEYNMNEIEIFIIWCGAVTHEEIHTDCLPLHFAILHNFPCSNGAEKRWYLLHPAGTFWPPKTSTWKDIFLPWWTTQAGLVGLLGLVSAIKLTKVHIDLQSWIGPRKGELAFAVCHHLRRPPG